MKSASSVVDFLNKVKDYRIPMIYKDFGMRNGHTYEYPSEVFQNLRYTFSGSAYGSISDLEKRRSQLKELLDLYKAGHTSVPFFHLGIFFIYGQYFYNYIREDLKESIIGKRRVELFNSIPEFRAVGNDDFIGDTWYSLIKKHENLEWERNPHFHNVRLLFNPEFFSNYGRGYDEVDWVEPIPNGPRNDCYTYTKETDPMKEKQDDNYIVGTIEVGPDGGGLRHFLNGDPIHAGSIIEVKFGKGWLEGRYEWSFRVGEPIKIYSGSERIFIEEGHLIRRKK